MKYKIAINGNFYTTLYIGFEGRRDQAEKFAEEFVQKYAPNIVLDPPPERLLDISCESGCMDLEIISLERCSSMERDPEIDARRQSLELGKKLSKTSSEFAQHFEGSTAGAFEVAKLILEVGSKLVGELTSMTDAVQDQSPQNQVGLIIDALRQSVMDNGADWIDRFASSQSLGDKGHA
ncbi:MAG TPA: hypothetical protein VGC95_12745 [Chitinophagaceae bacterium]|jgi:hypothetical protein